MMTHPLPRHLVAQYHEALPLRIRRHLNARGITDPAIDLHLLGWNGERMTLPIFDREGHLAFFKLAKDPGDTHPGPKMLATPGARAELYGWERVNAKPCRIVVSEGEFDRLVLESNGFAAVTSTGGANVFRPQWAEVLREVPKVFLCFDRDEAGRKGSHRVARMIPHARIVELPEGVGEGGDVTDFFVRLGRSREDFEKLLGAARSLLPEKKLPPPNSLPTPVAGANSKIARIKSKITLEDLVGRYMPLRRVGRTFVGRCLFHDDHAPSFVVYPDDQHFHCFGCGAHGDALDFLMRIEKLTFPEAVETLRRAA